jgi:hypothetical protein
VTMAGGSTQTSGRQIGQMVTGDSAAWLSAQKKSEASSLAPVRRTEERMCRSSFQLAEPTSARKTSVCFQGKPFGGEPLTATRGINERRGRTRFAHDEPLFHTRVLGIVATEETGNPLKSTLTKNALFAEVPLVQANAIPTTHGQ